MMKMKKRFLSIVITILIGVYCLSGCFESENNNHIIDLDDTDGDGLSDEQENALGTNSSNSDSDGDGISDYYETDNGTVIDTDGDTVIDILDDDDDGDSIPTADEHPDDNDDGNPSDALDTDNDNDPNYLDNDDDNDSIFTITEIIYSSIIGDDVDNDGYLNYQDTDSDNDSIPDRIEGTKDNDGDSIPNFLDSNDNDGPFGDLDGDGLSNEVEGYSNLVPPDTDNDGLPDYLDSDADGSSHDVTVEQARFIGSWYNLENEREHWSFYYNGSLKKTSIEINDFAQEEYLFVIWAFYQVNMMNVCFKDQDAPSNQMGICYDYNFSDNNTSLTMSVDKIVVLSLIRE